MKTKIKIKSIIGDVLFEYEKENNTIKDTVEAAVKVGANLGGANLGGAYLRGAYLEGAILEGASLEGANLGGANLRGAYLGGAYLRGAILRGAILRGAYLGGAYLGGAYLEGAYLEGAILEGANLGGAYLGADWGILNRVEDVLILGPIGSRNDYTTIYHTDKGIFVQCGCFKGSLYEFIAKVKNTHKGNKHEKDYLAMVEFAKVKFNIK